MKKLFEVLDNDFLRRNDNVTYDDEAVTLKLSYAYDDGYENDDDDDLMALLSLHWNGLEIDAAESGDRAVVGVSWCVGVGVVNAVWAAAEGPRNNTGERWRTL